GPPRRRVRRPLPAHPARRSFRRRRRADRPRHPGARADSNAADTEADGKTDPAGDSEAHDDASPDYFGLNYSETDTNSGRDSALTAQFGRYSSARGRTALGGFLGLLDSLFGLVSRDVVIDLGTANTLVQVRGRVIVISEPSVVAKDARTGAVLAIGAEAKRMVGRTPASIIAI